jgi:hypothetical protein
MSEIVGGISSLLIIDILLIWENRLIIVSLSRKNRVINNKINIF